MMKATAALRHLLALVALLLLSTPAIHSQSDAQLSQYYDIPGVYNSAATGLGDLLRLRGAARMQWVGVKGAPRTFASTADMPLRLMSNRFGIGVALQQETIGLFDQLDLGLRVAYHRPMFKGILGIGANIGFLDRAFRGTEVIFPGDDDYHQSTDEAIPTTDLRGNALDLGLGVWYSHPRWWAGLSVNHLNAPTINLNAEGAGSSATGESNYVFNIQPTAYFMAGCNIPVKNTLIEMIPSLMVKTYANFFTGEVNARMRYNKFISGGIGYRYRDAVTINVGAELKGVYVAYTYDIPASAIGRASGGSHEIVAGYSLKLDLSDKNKNRHKSIRIM